MITKASSNADTITITMTRQDAREVCHLVKKLDDTPHGPRTNVMLYALRALLESDLYGDGSNNLGSREE